MIEHMTCCQHFATLVIYSLQMSVSNAFVAGYLSRHYIFSNLQRWLPYHDLARSKFLRNSINRSRRLRPFGEYPRIPHRIRLRPALSVIPQLWCILDKKRHGGEPISAV